MILEHMTPGPSLNMVDAFGRRVIFSDSRWDGDTLMVAPHGGGGGYVDIMDGITLLGWYPNDDITAEIVFKVGG